MGPLHEAPEGLPADPAAARASVHLPVFGQLCARAATALGLPEETFASAAQRRWLASARDALGAMAEGGAPVGGYSFQALDDRPAMLVADSLAALASNKPWNLNLTMASNHRWSEGTPESFAKRHMGVSRETAEQSAELAAMAEIFGSAERARVHMVGHEFGHAWQSDVGLRPQRSAAEGTPLASGVADIATKLASWRVPREPVDPAAKLLEGMVSEATSDAIGCWAVERVFGARGASPLAQAATMRDGAQSEPGPNPVYDTRWMLDALARAHPNGLPERFGDLALSIQSIAKSHGPGLAAKAMATAQAATAGAPTASRPRAPS